ncbi:MAG: hypothetical protein ABIJ61_04735 [bacterium]
MQTTSSNTVSDNQQQQSDLTQLAGLIDRTLNTVDNREDWNSAADAHDPTQHRFHDVVDSLASRERELQALLKQLRRVLPATYFRTNSRVYRVMEEINKTVKVNEEAAFKLRDWSSQMDAKLSGVRSVLDSLRALRSKLH